LLYLIERSTDRAARTVRHGVSSYVSQPHCLLEAQGLIVESAGIQGDCHLYLENRRKSQQGKQYRTAVDSS